MLLFLILLGSLKGFSQDANEALKKVDKQFFIENKGQWNPEVLFLAEVNGLNTWITKGGVTFDFYNTETLPQLNTEVAFQNVERNKLVRKTGQVVKLTLQNSNSHVSIEGNEKSEAYYNYMIGSDKTKWATNVGLYKEVSLTNLYEGIDMRYYFDDNLIRYDYIVKPHANVSKIKMELYGTEKKYINEQGELVFSTVLGDVKQAKLVSYQMIEGKKIIIPSKFQILDGGGISFWVDSYDKTKSLIIDPIIYLTFISGLNEEKGQGIAIRNQQAYIAGGTTSASYPTSALAYQTTFTGLTCGFVSKLDAAGTLQYSTFVGGSFGNWFYSIDVDQTNGYAYVTGTTSSNLDYPTSAIVPTTYPSLNTSFQGVQDAVVTVLNETGTGLLYSTYLGGNKSDWGLSIKVDPSNFKIVYVGGYTYSPNFPVPTGSTIPGNTFTGLYDVSVTKINITSGTSGVLFSRFLSSGSVSGQDAASSLALEGTNIYVTGITNATTTSAPGTFPGALFGPPLNPVTNIFISKINSSGGIVYSTIGGGNASSSSLGIDVNSSGEAYIVGTTQSTTFPIIPTGTSVYNGGPSDIFVARLNSSGVVVNSRFIGGANEEVGESIKLFGLDAYITGWTLSNNYPCSPCPMSGAMVSRDPFVTELNQDLSSILFSRTIPIPGIDEGKSIAVDATGMYIAGYVYGGVNEDVLAVKLIQDVPPSPCTNMAATVLPTVISTSPVPNVNGFQINANTTITGTVFFIGMDIGISNVASIIVSSNAILTIEKSHLRGCANMWRGIIVQPGGQLIVQNNALIEDATTAISMINPPYSLTPLLTINQAIFNKNSNGIVISNYNQGSTVANPYPFIIKGAIFTSRNLYNCGTGFPNWWTVFDLQQTNTPINNVSTPYFMQNCPEVSLLNGSTCLTHIQLNNVGRTTMSGATPTQYHELVVGGNTLADLNIFELCNFGIDGWNSNIASVNAVFQKSKLIDQSTGGIGIRATKSPGVQGFSPFKYQVRCEPIVGGITTFINKFYDCFEGVRSSHYYTTLVNSSEFYSNQLSTNLIGNTLSTEVNLNKVGRKAVDIISAAYHTIKVNRNKIYNHTVGIYQVSGISSPIPDPAYPNIVLGYKEIMNNTINDVTGLANPPIDAFIGDGIVVGMVNGNGNSFPISTISYPFPMINYIYNNYISNAFRGITYSNVAATGLKSHINGNTIRLKKDVYIYHNDIGIQTILNNDLEVNTNTVYGIGFTSKQNLFTSYQSDLNRNQYVHCNNSEINYAGFRFQGVNTPTLWTNNTIENGHFYGLSLGPSTAVPTYISGIIGIQGGGSSPFATDNRWITPFDPAGAHTIVSANSLANNSILYVRTPNLPGIFYRPTLNAGPPPNIYNTGNLIPVPSAPPFQPCPSPAPMIMAPSSDVVALLEDVVQDSIAYTYAAAENEWMGKMQVYELQLSDSLYISVSPLLDSFYTTYRPQAMSDIHQVEDLIDAGNYSAALALAGSMSPTNTIEQNYLDYYNLLLPYIMTGVWVDSTMGQQLFLMANLCLYTNGAIVSNARILYNAIYREQYTVFNDECSPLDDEGGGEGGGGFGETGGKGSQLMNNFVVEVFPNPASKGFDLRSNCKENCNVSIVVSSLTGQKLIERKCNLQEGNCLVNIDLANGTYIVNITKNATNEVVNRKLLITN